MTVTNIIDKYYPEENELKRILLSHSECVAEKAISVARKHPQLGLDEHFLYEASMFHDIGIFRTHAPDISCFGYYPYICHGYLGSALMAEEGFLRHSLVCERHSGAGISLQEILQHNLLLPHRDMIPVSLEEQVICFADKFFSKSHLEREKSVDQAIKSISRHGEEGVVRFKHWCDLFL